jgi:hypothetical protein
MQTQIRKVMWTALPLLLVAASAVADNDVAVRIINNGTEDVIVTVYDMNIGPQAVVLAHTRINGFTAVPVSVAPDSSGRANLSWTAVSAERGPRKCGREDSVGLSASSTLTVRADSACGM